MSITLFYKKKELWKFEDKNKEFIRGILCMGKIIELSLIESQAELISTDTSVKYIYHTNDSDKTEHIDFELNSKYNYFQWFVNEDGYYLYGFKNALFFQGIITFANYCCYNFRNNLYGLIFDRYGKLYTLKYYNLLPYRIEVSNEAENSDAYVNEFKESKFNVDAEFS